MVWWLGFAKVAKPGWVVGCGVTACPSHVRYGFETGSFRFQMRGFRGRVPHRPCTRSNVQVRALHGLRCGSIDGLCGLSFAKAAKQADWLSQGLVDGEVRECREASRLASQGLVPVWGSRMTRSRWVAKSRTGRRRGSRISRSKARRLDHGPVDS